MMSKSNQMNELVVIESIEKRLRERRKEVVFPLTPTHRKELRELKDTNLGNLNGRLSTIRKLKEEEYSKKYKADILKELTVKQEICQKLNYDWGMLLEQVNFLLKERKKLEEKTDLKHIDFNTSYNDFSALLPVKDERKCSIDENKVADKIATEQFEKKYRLSFDEVAKRIEDIETKYEEAINFGDLEIVKELYYIMKSSEKLFEKIDSLKI